jgi:hypothetical protein
MEHILLSNHSSCFATRGYPLSGSKQGIYIRRWMGFRLTNSEIVERLL